MNEMLLRTPQPVLQSLIGRQTPGMSLEQAFYVEPSIFQEDLKAIIATQWLYVDHESVIPAAGDYFTYEVAGESIIIVRDRSNNVQAFYNVCRHRGSRICNTPKGSVRTLTCPYHAWVYGLDGKLVSAKNMPADFDPSNWGLKPCGIRVWRGLIFVNIAGGITEEVADFNEISAVLDPYLAVYDLEGLKIAHKEVYPTDANWKLAVENFLECYHCSASHPEYTMVNAYVKDAVVDPEAREKEVESWRRRMTSTCRTVADVDRMGIDELQPFGAYCQPIREGFLTQSADGKPLAPLLGDLTQHDGGETALVFGPLSHACICSDHAVMLRFTPINHRFTDVEVSWLVRKTAVEGKDYDVDALKWMWHQTTLQDTEIINNNQLGVDSHVYEPGPYAIGDVSYNAPGEGNTARFVAWYLNRLGSAKKTEPIDGFGGSETVTNDARSR